jgi:hypothetical protein
MSHDLQHARRINSNIYLIVNEIEYQRQLRRIHARDARNKRKRILAIAAEVLGDMFRTGEFVMEEKQ